MTTPPVHRTVPPQPGSASAPGRRRTRRSARVARRATLALLALLAAVLFVDVGQVSAARSRDDSRRQHATSQRDDRRGGRRVDDSQLRQECRGKRCRVARTRASVVNVKDGKLRYEVAFDVVVLGGSNPTLENSATAVTSCTECRTIVISVQLGLLNGDVAGLTTSNEAVSVQLDCVLCESLAAAYQFVAVSPGSPGFSRDARNQLRRIERQLKKVAKSSVPLDVLAAEVDALAARALTIMATDLGIALPGGQVNAPDVPVGELAGAAGAAEQPAAA